MKDFNIVFFLLATLLLSLLLSFYWTLPKKDILVVKGESIQNNSGKQAQMPRIEKPPSEQKDNTEQKSSVESVESPESAESVRSVGLVEPVQSTESVESVKPVQSVESVDSTEVVESVSSEKNIPKSAPATEVKTQELPIADQTISSDEVEYSLAVNRFHLKLPSDREGFLKVAQFYGLGAALLSNGQICIASPPESNGIGRILYTGRLNHKQDLTYFGFTVNKLNSEMDRDARFHGWFNNCIMAQSAKSVHLLISQTFVDSLTKVLNASGYKADDRGLLNIEVKKNTEMVASWGDSIAK